MVAVQLWWPLLLQAVLAVEDIADRLARVWLQTPADRVLLAMTGHLCQEQQDMSADCMEKKSAVIVLPAVWLQVGVEEVVVVVVALALELHQWCLQCCQLTDAWHLCQGVGKGGVGMQAREPWLV